MMMEVYNTFLRVSSLETKEGKLEIDTFTYCLENVINVVTKILTSFKI